MDANHSQQNQCSSKKYIKIKLPTTGSYHIQDRANGTAVRVDNGLVTTSLKPTYAPGSQTPTYHLGSPVAGSSNQSSAMTSAYTFPSPVASSSNTGINNLQSTLAPPSSPGSPSTLSTSRVYISTPHPNYRPRL